MPPREQGQASIALEAIKPFGVPLTRVVADWIERRREEKKALRFEEAMNLLIGSRSRSRSYLVSLRQTRNRMQIFHDSLMCNLSPDDLSVALDGMSDAVRNFTLRIPWAVCVFAQRRGYCTLNLAKAVATAPVTPPETEVYRPGETVAYARSGDVLVCCKLYRVGGSLKDLIDTVNLLKTTGIGFRVLTRQLDATTLAGLLIFHVFGAIAEFEKSLIQERSSAGPKAAKARDLRRFLLRKLFSTCVGRCSRMRRQWVPLTVLVSQAPEVKVEFERSLQVHLNASGVRMKREFEVVLTRGLEPPRVAPYGPEPYASANSAT